MKSPSFRHIIDIINEAARITEGRDAPLYHAMEWTKAQDVFANDTMPARWTHNIPGYGELAGNSFTRNKNLRWRRNPVVLEIDQAKLAQRHKIIPLDGDLIFGGVNSLSSLKGDIPSYRRDRTMSHKEGNTISEEFVIGDILQIHRYITKIALLDNHYGTNLNFWIHHEVSDYSKKWNITLEVDPKILHALFGNSESAPEEADSEEIS